MLDVEVQRFCACVRLSFSRRGTTVSNDVHLYDTSAGRWTTTEISPRPPGRFAHCACAGPEKSLFIFGGVNPGEDLSDVVVLVAP